VQLVAQGVSSRGAAGSGSGAIAATSLTGPLIEARLALGDDARTALAPIVRRSVHTGMVPVIDQTRSVGLVTLPGTFVVSSSAALRRHHPSRRLALLAVELVAGLLLAELVQRAAIDPGERVRPPDAAHGPALMGSSRPLRWPLQPSPSCGPRAWRARSRIDEDAEAALG